MPVTLVVSLFYALLILSGCDITLHPNGTPRDTTDDTATPTVVARSGAVLVQYSQFLYVIGGRDSAGSVVGTIQRARMHDDGTVDTASWKTEPSLPDAREGFAAFAAGNLIYVIGGRDRSGVPQDDIFFTYVDPDTGVLGFSGRWEQNPKSLPTGVADAAWAHQEGRIILAGGRTPDGVTDHIIHAGIYADGQIGHWYHATQTLSVPRYGAAAAVLQREGVSTLAVAGGTSGSTIFDALELFPLGENARLDPGTTNYLPLPLAYPVLELDGDNLLVGSGLTGASDSPALYRQRDPAAWAIVDGVDLSAMGPSTARFSGTLTYIQTDGESNSAVSSVPLGLAPRSPVIHPGSGLIPLGTNIRFVSDPGTEVRYRVLSGDEDNTEVTSGDPLLDGTLSVVGDVDLAFRAFGTDGRASPTIFRHYRVRSTSMIVSSLRITVEPTPPSTPENYLEVTPGWYFFDTSGGTIVLARRENPSMRLSVFENDFYTAVVSTDGVAMAEMEQEATNPAVARFPAGRFYIFVESINAGSDDPQTVGIALYRE